MRRILKKTHETPVTPGRFGAAQGWTRGRQEPQAEPAAAQVVRTKGIYQAKPPKIALVFCAFREEAILPFFLKHYWFVDKFVALLGKSEDRTEEILKADPRVEVRPLEFPGGFNDREKIEGMNKAVSSLDGGFDWVIAADADEFLWPPNDSGCGTLGSLLTRTRENVLRVAYRNVYRHVDDSNLDINSDTPPVYQRRHGDGAPLPGYIKPAVIRTKRGITFGIGHHEVYGASAHGTPLAGSHWAYADLSFCIYRSVRDRTQRMSGENVARGWGTGHYNETEDKVRHLCKQHEHDPIVVP